MVSGFWRVGILCWGGRAYGRAGVGAHLAYHWENGGKWLVWVWSEGDMHDRRSVDDGVDCSDVVGSCSGS